MDKYKSSERYHEVSWMLIHSEDLEKKAIRQKDTSKVLYCCLELRNCLEMIDFHLLLASVPDSEHQKITEIAKNFRGNDKANKLLKALSYKTQIFYECICSQLALPGVFFDYKKSNSLKTELCQYIHTYTRVPKEMEFDSSFIKAAFPLIKEVRQFIKASLISDGESQIVQNIDYARLEPEDKTLLQEWKDDKVDEENLRKRISENTLRRRKNS
jgi:hypothetical protein